ncbi:MAG: BatA and WFA domain-containing protein [Pirellulales bacterium]|nr:BatA and WFA domain-containing protein [Pirellulales bacterium]
MSWISMLQPWQWALLSAIPVGIILLYFLKLRREPVEVPSTYLWSRTIEDLHVNSLLQRLRSNLLLLLQLLAIAAAALALLRPGIRGEDSSQKRMVFLLDTSASMQATDVDGDESRFEKAKRLIRERIDSVTENESMMLVTFSDRAEVLQSFTTDRGRIREALDRAQVTNQPTDILGALKAADGLANPRRSSEVGDPNDVQVAEAMPADLLIYSDGGFDNVTEFDLGNLIPQYISVGSPAAKNLAITAFSAERNLEKPSEVQAFATVVNLGNVPMEAEATLSRDDQSPSFQEADAVSLEPGEQVGLEFTLDSEEAVSLRLELTAPNDQPLKDDLSIDNVAFAGLTPLRTVSVLLVTPGNKPLLLGMLTENAAKICIVDDVLPSYLQSEEYKLRAQSGNDDLIIYDRCAPAEMPLTNTFFIGALPPKTDAAESAGDAAEPATSEAGTTEAAAGGPDSPGQRSPGQPVRDWAWATDRSSLALIDMDRSHPIMRFMEVFSLLIFDGRAIRGPSGSVELMGADIGPMLVLAPRDGFQDMVLGFEIISTDASGAAQTNTNWHAERSWPVFILNVLRYLAGAAESSGAPSFQPGQTVQLRLESAITNATYQRVGGEQKKIVPGASGLTEIVDTEVPGNYRIDAEEELVDLFTINLFDGRESELAVAQSVDIGYVEVAAVTGGVETRVEYWRWVLLVMLVVLLAEWWLYARRVA